MSAADPAGAGTGATAASAATEVRFPDGFVWGAATSAFQIEGAARELGRTPSVWDVFCATEGTIRNGDTGEVACDHVHRYRDDVALLRDTGLGAYRFSISWPRVVPGGIGAVSSAGLGFYDRLVDELLGAGIEPCATLFHWDLPQVLHERGGWRSRDCADWFTEYAVAVVEALGDRVTWWATLNEPWCHAFLGHLAGVHAPGWRDPAAAVAVAHHQLLGHGRAVRALRDVAPAGRYGIALNPAPAGAAPGHDVAPDVVRRVDGVRNRWWFDSLLTGAYPADVLADLHELGDLAACVLDGDQAEIAAPLDWVGINYYNDELVRMRRPGDDPTPSAYPGAPDIVPIDPPPDATDVGWPITPDGLTRLLRGLAERYPGLPPLAITENGAAYDDPVIDGRCRDERRIAYYDAHLRALHEAIAAGVDVRAFFAWSLIDNFEWAWGYEKRFGLVHVDYATQQRTPRDSAAWLAGVARSNALPA